MANRPRRRRCPRCDRLTAATHCCGLDLAARRRLPWRMDADKVRLVHTLKARKGLDDETYRLRLGAVGVDSCKQLSRAAFRSFLAGLVALPDKPGWISTDATRRARG
jgi:hypothetical protein